MRRTRVHLSNGVPDSRNALLASCRSGPHHHHIPGGSHLMVIDPPGFARLDPWQETHSRAADPSLPHPSPPGPRSVELPPGHPVLHRLLRIRERSEWGAAPLC